MTDTRFTLSEEVLMSTLIKRYAEIEKEIAESKGRKFIERNSVYSLRKLAPSLKWFIKNKLEYDPPLRDYFIEKGKNGKGRNQNGENYGCGKDKLYVLFGTADDPKRILTKELVNLVCYYLFKKKYTDCMIENLLLNNDLATLANFRKLPGYFDGENKKNQYYSSEAERASLKMKECTSEYINEIKLIKIEQELSKYVELDMMRIKTRFEKNPDTVKVLKNIKTNKLVGFYIMYPISKRLVDLIESGTKQSAEQFDDDDIMSDFNSAHALYVSTVWSLHEQFGSSGILTVDLFKKCFYNLEHYKHLTGIYTKPRTDIGILLAEKYSFSELMVESEIKFLSREDAFAGLKVL